MIKLVRAMMLCAALCSTVNASDAFSDPAQKLLTVMDGVVDLARQAVPLAKQEFGVLEEKYKGDQSNSLIARLSAPMEMAKGLWWPENVQWFHKFVEANDRHAVAHLMIVTIGQMRGVDGVMLAAAVAGSPQAERLLDLYQHLEAGLFELEYAHQVWSNQPR
jgi:hypothetical protein